MIAIHYRIIQKNNIFFLTIIKINYIIGTLTGVLIVFLGENI